MSSRLPLAVLIVLLFFLSAGAAAQVTTPSSTATENGREGVWSARVGLFPGVYFTETINAIRAEEAARPYWVSTQAEMDARSNAAHASILLNNDILAFYGHPNSRNMGILGRYSIEELDQKLTDLVREYEAESGGRPVLKAFYIIFGTAWPEGEIGIINEALLRRYIEYGLDHNILIFIDHQIGRYDPVNSLKRMLPWLRYSNVHLALDPEWRTTKPMREIGTVTADEINRAQRVMEDYIIQNNIPGERMLVIHQFNWRMIQNREQVDSSFNRVRLVHCADGFGAPHLKRASYAYNAEATNIPIKGFKLFYNFGIPNAGYDAPLLTPKEVYALNPRPYIIMYQ
jgi:hypothetical protein